MHLAAADFGLTRPNALSVRDWRPLFEKSAGRAEEVAALISGSELHLYDNAGHAFHWEVMDDFNPRVLKWLTTH